MTKMMFILSLSEKLSGLPKSEIEERLSFYSEMIEDRIEDGLKEEDAVNEIGSVDEIADQIISEIPLTKIAKEKISTGRKLRVWEIILLALGSPVWLSLLISAFSVIVSLYAAMWSVIVALWASFAAFVGGGVGGLVGGIAITAFINVPAGLALIAAGLVLAGLSIFMFFGCKYATKGILILTEKTVFLIKRLFLGREEAR